MASKFRIVQANSPAEFRIARQLRYEIFIEELSLHYTKANPKEGLVNEADSQAAVFLAYDGDTPVGTMAIDCWKDVDLPVECIENYHLPSFAQAFSRDAVAVIRNLVVRQEYRGTLLFMQLLKIAADYVCRKPEIHFVFVQCSPDNAPLYERVGCRRYAPSFSDPIRTGPTVPLCFVMNDHEYLATVRSPLLPFLRRWGCIDQAAVRQYFEASWGQPNHAGENAPLAKKICPLPLWTKIDSHAVPRRDGALVAAAG